MTTDDGDGRRSRRTWRRRVALWVPVVLVGVTVACGGDFSPTGDPVVTTERPTTASTADDANVGDDADLDAVSAGGTDPAAADPDADADADIDAGPDQSEPGQVEGDGPEDLGGGLVLDLSLVADGGGFDPNVDTVVNVVIDLAGLQTEAIIEVDYEHDLVSTTITGNLGERVRALEDGTARVLVNRAVRLPDLGRHSLTFSGIIRASDGSFEFGFDRVIRFETTEIGEVPIEEIELVNGAVTLEASRRWAVVGAAASFSQLRHRAAVEGPIALELDQTEVLLDLVARDLRAVSVRRALRPLHLDDLEVIAQDMTRLLGSGEVSEPEPVELGGLSGWRVVHTSSTAVQTIDLLGSRDEVFLVQATSRPDRESVDEVAAVRDSLRFHPDRFDRLTHVIVWEVWLTVDDEPYFSIETDVPADWEPDPEVTPRFISPDSSRLLIRQSFTNDESTLEEFVVEVIEASVPLGAEATYELGERGGLEAATISIVGDPIGDAKSVVLTHGELFQVTTIRDDPDDPDPALISLIAASVRPVGPPSTN